MTDRTSPDDRDDESSTGERERTDPVDPIVRIVEAVAAETGRDPADMPPLQRIVDVDAMADVLARPGDAPPVSISFEYVDRVIEVDNRGGVSVES